MGCALRAAGLKLTTLKPRLLAISTTRVQVLASHPQMVERKRGGAGVRDRIKIKTRDCGLCQECRRKGLARPGYLVDHTIPLWAGGSDEDTNKQLLCKPCHDAKTAREAGERAGGGSKV